MAGVRGIVPGPACCSTPPCPSTLPPVPLAEPLTWLSGMTSCQASTQLKGSSSWCNGLITSSCSQGGNAQAHNAVLVSVPANQHRGDTAQTHNAAQVG